MTLRGLRLQQCSQGIVIAATRHLTLTDCTVRGNSGSGSGNGIANAGGTLRMTDCVVEDNGSGATIQGGGLFNDGGPATLTGCLFQRNRADHGGGIYNRNGGAIMTLIDTRVTNNTGTVGSGIHNVSGGSTVTLLEGSAVCANNPTEFQCFNVTETDGATCEVTCPD